MLSRLRVVQGGCGCLVFNRNGRLYVVIVQGRMTICLQTRRVFYCRLYRGCQGETLWVVNLDVLSEGFYHEVIFGMLGRCRCTFVIYVWRFRGTPVGIDYGVGRESWVCVMEMLIFSLVLVLCVLRCVCFLGLGLCVICFCLLSLVSVQCEASSHAGVYITSASQRNSPEFQLEPFPILLLPF